jgi:cytochrome c oxidase subunit II
MARPKTSGYPRRLGLAAAALSATALSAALSACASDAPQDTFKAEGPDAREIRNLAVPIGIIAIAVGLLVFAVIFVVIVKFRDRPGAPVPKQVHGNTKAEIIWTAIPAALLIGIAVWSIPVISKLDRKPADPLEITVVGQQWWWEFQYQQDEIVTANEMVIPAGKDVYLSITSRDVIHSFWIPRLAGKKDAVPGRKHNMNIRADRPGDYWGQCTEFCGLSHANMSIRVRALSAADYATWVASQRKDRVVPKATSAQAAGEAVYIAKCASCHQIDGITVKNGTTGKDEPLVVDASESLVAGAAPNLTHFATRSVFAGATFATYLDDPKTTNLNEADPYLAGDKAIPNRQQLEAWLRNPPAEVAMAPGDKRGMPNLKLSEQEIDDLSEYLLSLK